MEKIQLRLNDFLFNSGVLGIYKILEYKEKEEFMTKKNNELEIDLKAFECFAQDYIDTMIHYYEKDTKYFAITNQKILIENINLEEKENENILDEKFKFIKKCMESASYKAGYEIIKEKNEQENPYEKIENYRKEKDINNKKQIVLNIINHVQKYKEVYCMKDIIYTKINSFWENVSFLNRNNNKKDIKQEYEKTFVIPFQEYVLQERRSELNCIECGNSIAKKEANGMSWLKDIGVDVNRKKSGFWHFNEDTYICPICNLVYSCIPLGFTLIGSNGIFINHNESIQFLISDNKIAMINEKEEKESYEKVYHRVLYNFINQVDQIGNVERTRREVKNIQIIKRIGNQDNIKYNINTVSKDKLEIIKKTLKSFEHLKENYLYQEIINNLLEGRKQYKLLEKNLRDRVNMNYIKDILKIQLNCIGGEKMKEKEQLIDEIIRDGELLQIYFYKNGENQNKLKSYSYKLQNSLRENNIDTFMKIFTLFYGSLGIKIPNSEAIKILMKKPEMFRLLGYAYIYGLEKVIDKSEKKENEGGI